MFRVIPIRMSMWRAGWVMMTLSLIASLVGATTDRLNSPGIALAPPSNDRSWIELVVIYLLIVVCGWFTASALWSRWRRTVLAQPVTVVETPTARVRWTWTMKQLIAGVLVLIVGAWLSIGGTETVDEEWHVIISVAVALGTIGVSYLILAWRVGKLERERGIAYYWQRQPGILSFEGVGVYGVPIYAVTW